MHTTRKSWLPGPRSAWFQLTRHDDPEPPAPEGADPAEPDPDDEPEPEPAPDEALGEAGKKALQRERAAAAAAKKEAAAAKRAAAEAQRRIQEFEDRDKSELDKATTAADRAAARADKATRQAVKAEVKAAAGEFADPEDAIAFLGEKLADYTDDDGEIDTDGIASDLADLLERKPHLKRADPTPSAPKAPRPDPGQGARPPEPPTDYRTAPRDELAKKLAEYGVRLRR